MTPRSAAVLRVALVAALGFAAGCGGPRPVSHVVIVTFDTTRADRLGCYGYDGGTSPNLDGLAAGSALFENAVSPVPTTLPAHSSLFTGLYPQDHGVRYNLVYKLGPDAVTLAELLEAKGWATAGFPASFVVDKNFGLNQGFQTYPDPPPPTDPATAPGDSLHVGFSATEQVDRALAWLGAHAGDEHTFLWVHFYDPHAPYAPPFPYSSKFRDHPYDGEIAYADAQFGRLLEYLRSSGDWDRTLLIVAGDHGEGLHDHRERFHANLVYETTQHVALVVHGPGIRPRRIPGPVSLVDVMPTVLELAGLPARGGIRGRTLVPALRGRAVDERSVYFESLAGSLNYGWQELHGIREGSWKLIDSQQPELFDLSVDPNETQNLAGREAGRLSDLRSALSALSSSMTAASQAEPAHDLVDSDTEAFLASLGYLTPEAGGSASTASNPRDLIDLEPELLAGQRIVADRDWPRLEEVTRYVLGRDPSNKWALVNLIGALEWQNRWDEAQNLSAELILLYPEADRGYTHMARAYKAQGKVEKAHEVLGEGLAKAPGSMTLRYLYLVAGFDLGLEEVCPDQVTQATQRFPRSGLIRVLSARCAARAGDTATAMKEVEHAVDLGFDSVGGLGQVEDFAQVARLPEFEALVRREASRASGGTGAQAGTP